jgi:hypothetical protein
MAQVITKQMVRDILSFNQSGITWDKLINTIKQRAPECTAASIKTLVEQLKQEGVIELSLETGTWTSKVKLT